MVSPLFPPTVTAGVAWTQVTTRTLLTGVVAEVVVDVVVDVDVEVADRGVAVVEVGVVDVVVVVCCVAASAGGAKICANFVVVVVVVVVVVGRSGNCRRFAS